jgi:hypothetical protein
MEFIEKLKRMVLMRIYSNTTVIVLELKNRKPSNTALRIEKVTEKNVNDALAFQPSSKIKVFKKFLTLGYIGYYAYVGDACVHRSWLVPGPSKVLLHKFYGIVLTSNDVFVQFCETALAARGKNIFTDVLIQIGQDFALKRVLISVEAHNTSSQKSMAKAGFEELYRKRIRVILGFRFIN